MESNIEKYENDFNKLKTQATQLHMAMQNECEPEQFKKAVNKNYNDIKKTNAYIKTLPDFKTEYQSWYSETKTLIKQLLIERYDDFKKYYETPKGRKDVTYENYTIEDYMLGLSITRGYDGKVVAEPKAAIPKFRQQIAIFESLASRFKSSLYEIKALVQSDLFDSELDAASELLKHKYYRSSGALSGIVLEKHLKEICINHNIKLIKKTPVISDYNEALKASEIIDVPTWRFIQHLADIRNLCDHSKDEEPTADQIKDLITGIDKIIKTVF